MKRESGKSKRNRRAACQWLTSCVRFIPGTQEWQMVAHYRAMPPKHGNQRGRFWRKNSGTLPLKKIFCMPMTIFRMPKRPIGTHHYNTWVHVRIHSLSPIETHDQGGLGVEQLINKMSTKKTIVCKHCKRDNFKSEYGLQMHLDSSETCNSIRRDREKKLKRSYDTMVDKRVASLEVSYEDNDASSLESLVGISLQQADTGDLALADIITELQDDDWGCGGDDSEEEEEEIEGYAGEALRNFREYVRTMRDDALPFDENEEAAVRLMDILMRKKATLDTYDEVMQWHIEQSGSESGQKRFIARNKMINVLAERYNMPTKMVNNKKVLDMVKKRQVVLPSSGAKVDIIYHDARDQVVSLLTDPRFGDDDWLHYGNDPFAPIPIDLDYFADINTGLAYRKTYDKLITKPGKQMLMPILLYIDGAITGQFDKMSVEAMKMTLGILNRVARDREYAWRTLGYCPNYTKSESRGKKILEESAHIASLLFPVDEDEGVGGEEESGDEKVAEDFKYDAEKEYELRTHKAQDLHRVLAAIMHSYKELEEKSMLWDYKYRGKVYKNVELFFFVMFIKCDTDEADKLCGSYTCRGKNVSQLCRYCTCPTDKTDKVDANYPKKTVEMIRKLVEKNTASSAEKLRLLSQQNIKNAFHDILFALHNGQGVHGACPMEMLHHILLGIFKYLRDCFLLQVGLTSAIAEEINALAKILGKIFARQSDRELPKTNFSKGIFEGKLMGKEFSGVLLLIAAILQTAEGRKLLKSVRGGRFSGEGKIDNWILLVETCIEWEAFLKLDRMEAKHVTRLKKKHQFIMFLLKKICKRTKGMGLKIMKFHGILHLIEDIIAYGVPTNVDTGSVESHHKKTKVAAKMTQRNITVFEEQTARRLVEFQLIELGMAELNGRVLWEYFTLDQERGPTTPAVAEESNKVETTGTAIRSFLDAEDGEVTWNFRRSTAPARWETTIVDFLGGLQQHVKQKCGIDDMNVRTEHKRGGQIFRGHPNYRQTGQWNDWAVFNWGPKHGKLPGEIWCFVDFTEAPAGFKTRYAGCALESGVYAVMESARMCPNVDASGDQINDSDLFKPIIKELPEQGNNTAIEHRTFYLANVEAIVSTACVIPDIGSTNQCRYFQVAPRNSWAKLFTMWLDQVHTNEEEEMKAEDAHDSKPRAK